MGGAAVRAAALPAFSGRYGQVRLLFAALLIFGTLQLREHPKDQRRTEANQYSNRHRTNTDKLVHRLLKVFSFKDGSATFIAQEETSRCTRNWQNSKRAQLFNVARPSYTANHFFPRTFAATFNRSALSRMKPVASSWL